MRNFILLLLCVSVTGCGLIHRTKNVARSIYTENEQVEIYENAYDVMDDADYLTAFSFFWQSPEPQPVIEENIPVEQAQKDATAAEELNKIKPAAEEDPALYTPSGEIFTPLCLLNNIGTIELPIHPTATCGRSNIEVLDQEAFLSEDKKYIAIRYRQHQDIAPQGGAESSDQTAAQTPVHTIKYRNIGTTQGLFALHVVIEKDGTEENSILGLYDFSVDVQGKDTLERRKTLVEGAQCHNGVDSFNIDPNTVIRFASRKTPLGLMLLPYAHDAEKLAVHEVTLASLDSCATCCVGTYHMVDETPEKFVISPDYITEFDQREKAKAEAEAASLAAQNPTETSDAVAAAAIPEQQACFDRILAALYKNGLKELSVNDLGAFIGGVEKNCFNLNNKADEAAAATDPAAE